MKNSPKASSNPDSLDAFQSCNAFNIHGKPCKLKAIAGKKYCRYHSNASERVVEISTKTAAGTVGYVAGLLSGAASSDFYEYLKKEAGFEHFFPPVRLGPPNFKEIELGAIYEPNAVLRSYIASTGSDFIESRGLDWVLQATQYFFFVFEMIDHYGTERISSVLEVVRPLTSSGTGGVESHLIFLRSKGVSRYIGKINGAWIQFSDVEPLTIYGFSGKDWGECWQDTFVYNSTRNFFEQTEKQVRGYFRNGKFRAEN